MTIDSINNIDIIDYIDIKFSSDTIDYIYINFNRFDDLGGAVAKVGGQSAKGLGFDSRSGQFGKRTFLN